jgi:hypothetical protein
MFYLSPEFVQYLKESYTERSYFSIANVNTVVLKKVWAQESLKRATKYKDRISLYKMFETRKNSYITGTSRIFIKSTKI